jgi:molybdate transport system substrate-binding protein
LFIETLPMMHRRTLLGASLGAGVGAMGGVLAPSIGLAQPGSAVVTVAAASDLRFALDEVAADFEKRSGHRLRVVYGSSGQFYAQILQGAPFQVFMSADERLVFQLADAGKTLNRGRLYAFGRIGVFTPHGSPLQPDGSLKDLGQALADGRLNKLAMANPEHAPYGARAQEALTHAGLWQRLQPHLVFGENISQAAHFAVSGATQGGIIAYSLALAPQLARLGRFELIPQNWHQPLAQRMVVLKGAPPAAQAFYDHLATPAAQAVMAKYGFATPPAAP